MAIIIYICICVLLVALILLQQSQSGGLGILGGSSNTVLGSSQEDVISKVIKFLAILFVVSAVFLSIMGSGGRSVLDQDTAPVNPEAEIDQIIQDGAGTSSTNADEILPTTNAAGDWLNLETLLQPTNQDTNVITPPTNP